MSLLFAPPLRRVLERKEVSRSMVYAFAGPLLILQLTALAESRLYMCLAGPQGVC